MSALPELFEWPWWKAFWRFHHVTTSPDEIPPPAGYESWLAYFNAIGGTMATLLPLGPAGGLPSEGSKLSMVFTRPDEDVATIGMHFVHRDGTACAPFTDDDAAAVEARATTLWNAIKAEYTDQTVLDRYEWHHFGVTVRKPNPHWRETILAPIAGTGGDTDAQLPPQVAISVTFRTDRRKSWGRVYLPAPANSSDTILGGRIETTTQTAIRNAFGTFIDGCAGDDLPLVVWSPRHDGAALQFFKADGTHPSSAHELGLDEPDTSSYAKTVDVVQVDDLYDVIRSRRFDRASSKLTHTVGA